jgi:hypothetical protein
MESIPERRNLLVNDPADQGTKKQWRLIYSTDRNVTSGLKILQRSKRN